jgi:hypothetical protein
MPKFVQQIAGKSYSFVEPRVDWVRGKVSVLDGACGKVETLVTPVIITTDRYIDSAYDAVTARASVVRASVSKRVAPVQAKISDGRGMLVAQGLGFVDSSENLIDRLLPLPRKPVQDQRAEEKESGDEAALAYRIARLPFAVPMRVTMIMYMKANGAVDAMCLSARQFAGLAHEKQARFAQHVMQRARPLTDRISDISTASVEKVRSGKDSAVRSVTVRVNNMVVSLHLVEARQWSLEKASSLKMGGENFIVALVHGLHGTTTRIVGEQRATTLFSTLRLPLELAEIKSK